MSGDHTNRENRIVWSDLALGDFFLNHFWPIKPILNYLISDKSNNL